jgi:futalosine hydrolase
MRLLIVSATPFEIAPLLERLENEPYRREHPYGYKKGPHEIHILITGVGIALTTYALTRTLAGRSFDLVINAGIAGSFHRTLPLGAVVQVISEQFGDLGVEEADGSFTDVFSLGLQSPDEWPFTRGSLKQPEQGILTSLPGVRGLTVHRVHGYPPSIEACRQHWDADIETMEGAAVFMVCLLEKQPFLALRSISNYVEARNREAWEIPLAIDQLNETLLQVLEANLN